MKSDFQIIGLNLFVTFGHNFSGDTAFFNYTNCMERGRWWKGISFATFHPWLNESENSNIQKVINVLRTNAY